MDACCETSSERNSLAHGRWLLHLCWGRHRPQIPWGFLCTRRQKYLTEGVRPGSLCRFVACELCESTQPLSPSWHSLTLLEHLDRLGVSMRGAKGDPEPAQQRRSTGRKPHPVPVSSGTDVPCLSWKSDPPVPSCLLAIPIKIIIGFIPLSLTF